MTSLRRLRSLLHTPPWRQRLSLLLVVGIFLAGLGLRLIDLTDQPLETDPSRQQTAVNLWHSLEVFEPQVFERVVAVTYLLLGAEVLWVGTLGISAVLLLPVVFAVTRYFQSGYFNFDWLLPMELAPLVLVFGLLLFWAAVRAKSHSRPIAWGMLIAIVMLIASMAYAVWSGLASGETEAAGTPWMIATAIITLSEFGMLITAISGFSLLKALKKK
jgi:hypothetical protein